MPLDYIPQKDADLDAWAANFSAVITATPTAYGLVAGQAVAFDTLTTEFTAALLDATNPATRTSVTVAAKDAKRLTLVASARSLGQIAQAFPAITDALLATAGLTVPDPVITPIPAPTSQVVLSIGAIQPGVLTVPYHDSIIVNPRSKPFGAVAIQLGRKTGAGAPANFAACDFIGQFSRSPMAIDTSSLAAGTITHYIARWVTAKGLVGPDSAVLSTVAA